MLEDFTDKQILEVGYGLEEEGLSHSEIDEFLAHYGVKGMKWGERKAARQRNRQLNRESRARDHAADNRAIDRARGRVASGKTQAKFDEAKSQHKANKKNLGTREARKKLNEARAKRDADIELSQMAKHGRETTQMLVLQFGSVLLKSLAA